MTQKLTPAKIIPPYNILLRSIIAKFSEESGISLDTLEYLKNEQMAIAPDLAAKIHAGLGNNSPSIEFWLTLQQNYEGYKLEEFQERVQAVENEKEQWEQERIAKVTAAIEFLKKEEPNCVPEGYWDGIKCVSIRELCPHSNPSDYDGERIEVLLVGIEDWGAEDFLYYLEMELRKKEFEVHFCCEEVELHYLEKNQIFK